MLLHHEAITSAAVSHAPYIFWAVGAALAWLYTTTDRWRKKK